jgi:hypothetical protein
MTSDLQDQILTKIAKQMQQEIDEQFMSMLMNNPSVKIHDQSIVDGETWYTVSCSHAASRWMRSQDREFWHEHIQNKWDVIHNTFDIHEKLYTMLALKWSS